MRLAKQIVFKAMTLLNSIGDYKNKTLDRYLESYKRTTSYMNQLLIYC